MAPYTVAVTGFMGWTATLLASFHARPGNDVDARPGSWSSSAARSAAAISLAFPHGPCLVLARVTRVAVTWTLLRVFVLLPIRASGIRISAHPWAAKSGLSSDSACSVAAVACRVVRSIFYRDSGSGPAQTNALPARFGFSCGWLARWLLINGICLSLLLLAS